MTNPTTKCARNTSNFNETSNLKLLVNFISVFEGVWVKFEKKRKSHFVLHIYRRADNNFQENWWPRRYILRLLLFLQPLSGGRRTRLTIRYYCETSRLVYLAVVQTSWSCQSKCQRLRAALLLHNFPLSWNYVKHVNRVVYGFKPFHRALISTLIFLLLLCGFCVAANTTQAYKSAILWQMQFENSSGHICSIPDEGKVLYSKRTKLTELGVAKCYPLNPWNPPNLSLKKGKHLSATKILSTGY